jgi:hypothetical protein
VPNGLIIPGSEDSKQITQTLRLRMLKSAFSEIPFDETAARASVEKLSQQMDAIDAIYIGVVQEIMKCILTANIDGSDFLRAQREYQQIHHNRKFSLDAPSPTAEMMNTVNHGAAVMLGIYEAIPGAYAQREGHAPDMQTLHQLIPSSADRMLARMTQMTAVYVLQIEKLMGMEYITFNRAGQTMIRVSFDSSKLQLRDIKGKETLDIQKTVADKVLRSTRGYKSEYHGCLAWQVDAPRDTAGAKQKLFQYVQGLFVSLMKEHWFPKIANN